MKEFAELVRVYRRRARLSQQELADKIGLSRGTIMHIENEKQNVYLLQALLISRELGFDISTLATTADGEIK